METKLYYAWLLSFLRFMCLFFVYMFLKKTKKEVPRSSFIVTLISVAKCGNSYHVGDASFSLFLPNEY